MTINKTVDYESGYMEKLPALLLVSVLLLTPVASQFDSVTGEKERYIVAHEPGFDNGRLKDLGADIVFDYSIIDGAAVEMAPATASQAESLDSIESVQPDIPVIIPVMDGDGDDTDRDHYGGEGTVAVLDTGVDDDHVDLDDRVISNEDVRDGKNDPEDRHGHGTHVASILAGTGEGNSRYRGVAPNAEIRNYKVLDDTGSGDMSTVIKGVEEASKDSDIIVLSLGAKVDECDGTDPLSQAVNNAADKGVAVVVASGNEGPDKQTVTSPGCAKKAFTVGSSHRKEDVSDFSSRGPTSDGRVKPDIVAQGENIFAAEAGTREGYVSKSGTSMAAPYVAGAVAALMEEKDTSNSEYYSSFMDTAFSLGYGKNAQGHGNINITAAEEHLTGSSDYQDPGNDDQERDGRKKQRDGTQGDSSQEKELEPVEIDAGNLVETVTSLIQRIKQLIGSIL